MIQNKLMKKRMRGDLIKVKMNLFQLKKLIEKHNLLIKAKNKFNKSNNKSYKLSTLIKKIHQIKFSLNSLMFNRHKKLITLLRNKNNLFLYSINQKTLINMKKKIIILAKNSLSNKIKITQINN